MNTGTRLTVTRLHLVDQDDAGKKRLASPGDVGTIERIFANQTYSYAISSENGASGFYSSDEIRMYFSIPQPEGRAS